MDPVSDMFIRIKNAQKAGKESVHVPYSKFNNEIIEVLHRVKLVDEVERRGKKARRTLEVSLRYDKEGKPAITDIKLLSRPSRRLYSSYREFKLSQHGGVVVVSTPQGVKSVEEARKAKVGGQLLAEIW